MTNLLKEELVVLAKSYISYKEISERFLKRVREGGLTQDENPETHFCVYFAAFDPKLKEVFLGHHIKSGLWLFNGGHINKDEALKEAVKREIDEEWGIKIDIKIPKNPSLLTITNIDNLPKQLCKRHYEIWFFIRVKKNKFFPDEKRLEKEFYETRWLTGEESRKLVIDPETLHGLKVIGSTF